MWPFTTLALAMLWLGGSTSAATLETPHLKVTTSIGAANATTLALLLDVAPKPRMHVYAPGQAGYIAITLTLASQPGLIAATPRFPPAETVFLAQLDETQLIYSRPFRISQDVTLTRDAGQARTIKGSLRYQACDDRVCYPPRTIAVQWRIGPKTL